MIKTTLKIAKKTLIVNLLTYLRKCAKVCRP